MASERTSSERVITDSTVENTPAIIRSPAPRLSIAANVDYHMIQDYELTQLSNPEGGILGSIGFTLLGAAIGLVPSVTATLKRANSSTTQDTTVQFGELVSLVICGGCFLGSIICLAIFGIAKARNSGLAQTIRNRPKRPLTD